MKLLCQQTVDINIIMYIHRSNFIFVMKIYKPLHECTLMSCLFDF